MQAAEVTATKTLDSLKTLQQEAAAFVATLSPKVGNATLVTLSGELGAGKTSFTQGLAHTFGITETVTSPTFVLEKIYDLPETTGHGFMRLIHIDAYRLEGENSLTPLGFDELMQDPKNLVVLEWPELVASQLPAADVSITLTVVPEGRAISYA